VPGQTMWERLSGKRSGDIELPNESGKQDARLDDDPIGKVRKNGVLKSAGPNIMGGIKILQDKGLIGKRSPSGGRR
jgi:hypothetical protein